MGLFLDQSCYRISLSWKDGAILIGGVCLTYFVRLVSNARQFQASPLHSWYLLLATRTSAQPRNKTNKLYLSDSAKRRGR